MSKNKQIVPNNSPNHVKKCPKHAVQRCTNKQKFLKIFLSAEDAQKIECTDHPEFAFIFYINTM